MKVEFEDNIPRIKSAIEQGAELALLESTIEWHSYLVENVLVGNRSGRQYRIPGGKRLYRASSPNEAPASRTGALRSSYRFRTYERGNTLIGEVGSPLPYAVHLEYGTKRMAPRPHLMVAYENREREIKRILGRAWIK